MASFPHFPTPPPPPHTVPPPPHAVPPPPPIHPITPPPHVLPPPPPSSPDNGPTVIIVVFISFGCIFFLAFCLFALCCLKKRKKKTVQETDTICIDEHLKVKEAIVPGPHGPETVILSMEEDKHTEEQIIEKEKLEGKHMHAKSGEIGSTDLEAGESSSNPTLHHCHHLLEHNK